ncbi:hypothetical protein AB833_04725 [Chromatiales bacterium (ex Bugula neritina AB1)]|nr:hypothetical protein AB833_04725 [Chromatiales bacterium (ex Bugula neritina AB1)]
MVLGAFALAIASVLTLVNLATKPSIEANKLAYLDKQLADVLPGSLHTNLLQQNPLIITDTRTGKPRTIYIARNQEKAVSAVITANAADGYSGEIEFLVGILPDGQLTGVRVIDHSETPGLGDDIELDKSNWVLQFDGKTISLPVSWAVKRDGGDFDQLTGATITSRAIVREVHHTLEFFHTNQQQLFTQ